ncbi:hypothetical protein HDU89_007611 [Geranomyces variabilis]|nr:hypothetical protein HDU89_007611 [Geranomyces variabilis]
MTSASKFEAPVRLLIQRLKENYVIPDVGDQIAAHIEAKLESGAFNTLADEEALATVLSTDLLHINNDGHLQVTFSSAVLGEDIPPCQPDAELPIDEEDAIDQRMWGGAEIINCGIKKVESLKGGIGLVAIQGFLPTALAGPAITAAFTLVASSAALIVDLRTCFGGDGDTADLVLSYLVPRRIHTNDTYWRPSDNTEQRATADYVPGPRYLRKRPVYVLTSEKTFSCAEKFAGTIQALKRATIVGETTGGAGHPCHSFRISDHLAAAISIGKTTNRATGRGWEGTGITPDVKCAADDALEVAHALALRAVKDNGLEGPGMIRQMLARDRKTELEGLEKKLQALRL